MICISTKQFLGMMISGIVDGEYAISPAGRREIHRAEKCQYSWRWKVYWLIDKFWIIAVLHYHYPRTHH
jgi:hypothetical protein